MIEVDLNGSFRLQLVPAKSGFLLFLLDELRDGESFFVTDGTGERLAQAELSGQKDEHEVPHLDFSGLRSQTTLNLFAEVPGFAPIALFENFTIEQLANIKIPQEDDDDDDAGLDDDFENPDGEEEGAETLFAEELKSTHLRDSPFLRRVMAGDVLLKKGGEPAHEATRKIQLAALELLPGLSLGASGNGLGLDGDFGSKTKAAIERFQETVQVKSDGIVGPITLKALDEELRDFELPAFETPPPVVAGAVDLRGDDDDRTAHNLVLTKVDHSQDLKFNYLGRTKLSVEEKEKGLHDPLGKTLSMMEVKYSLTPSGRVSLGEAQLTQAITLFTPYRSIEEFKVHYARFVTEFNSDHKAFALDPAVRVFHTRGATYRHELAHAKSREEAARRMMFGSDTVLDFLSSLGRVDALASEKKFVEMANSYWNTWTSNTNAIITHDEIYEMDALNLIRELEDAF